MKLILKIALFTSIFTTNLKAQTIDASLLEINFAGDGNPKNITKGNTKIYFSADDGIHGRELWVFNSVTNKTNIVKDIYSDSHDGLYDSKFIAINDQLYFTANDGIDGIELWTSDGTEAGTYLLKNINNSGDCSINKFAALNGSIIFSANDGINGQEIWISDGTTTGTSLLKDIYPGSNGSNPTDFFVFNNNAYFSCNNGTNGIELWKSNGTTAGTTLLKDINPGANSSIMSGNNFIIFNTNFYFFANNGSVGSELWKSDGTITGTQLVKDINIGTNSSASTMIGSATSTYFVFEAVTAANGNELWKSNGTTAGTVLLKDVDTTSSSSFFNSEFATFNNKVYFVPYTNTNGDELWVTDGTTAGTQMVKDINIGANSSSISKLTSTNNFIIFSANDGSNSYNTLWKSNGTAIGTTQVKNINLTYGSNELFFVELNNLVYFQGGYNSDNGIELWKTDGTQNNTQIVKDVYHKYSSNSISSRNYTELNGKLVFSANDGIHGEQAFITDGTINGTKLLKGSGYSIFSCWCNDYIPSYTKAGNNIFFRATDGTHGFEIFKTDGTDAGTAMVKDIAVGPSDSLGEDTLFMEYNNIFYFKANNQVNGQVLWRSDGTDAGTYIVKPIYVYGSNIYQNHYNIINQKSYAVLNGYLYFTANDGTGFAIWRTDGTNAGTIKVITVLSNQGTVSVPVIINANSGKLFFTSNIDNSSYGNNTLWSSDGTQVGTTLLGSWFISGPSLFKKNIVFNNQLYFTVFTANGPALMKSDGTLSGTSIVKDNFTAYETFNTLSSCGNYVYFTTGQTGIWGKELWRTDGTPTGTIKLEEIPLSTNGNYANCVCSQNNLFYYKEILSNKIWYVNNTQTTPSYFDVNVTNSDNFSTGEGITDIVSYNQNLIFEAIKSDGGNELYYSSLAGVLNVNENQAGNLNLSNINLYPNPNNGIVAISSNDNSNIQNIEVYDLLGKKIKNQIFNNNIIKLNIQDLDKGIYILKIKANNNIETKKLILK